MAQTYTRTNRGDTYAGHTTLEVEVCCSCGVLFAAPRDLLAHALKDHDHWFYCPNGHSQHYTGKTEAQKQRERADREADRAARCAAERDQALASARAQRGAATRARNQRDRVERRAAAGVCPCCNRTFKQLARHMRSQHPGFPEHPAE
jgi:hypothetical protein